MKTLTKVSGYAGGSGITFLGLAIVTQKLWHLTGPIITILFLVAVIVTGIIALGATVYTDKQAKAPVMPPGVDPEAFAIRTQPMPHHDPRMADVTALVEARLIEKWGHTPGVDPWPLIYDQRARTVNGIIKYKTPLQPFNGRDARLDYYQEGCDMLKYLVQQVYEWEWLNKDYRLGDKRERYSPVMIEATWRMVDELSVFLIGTATQLAADYAEGGARHG